MLTEGSDRAHGCLLDYDRRYAWTLDGMKAKATDASTTVAEPEASEKLVVPGEVRVYVREYVRAPVFVVYLLPLPVVDFLL